MRLRPRALLLASAVLVACPSERDHSATHDPVTDDPSTDTPPPTTGGGETPPVVTPGVPVPPDGFTIHREVGAVLGVGVDEGGTVWTVDGDGIWALPVAGAWTRFTGLGQLARGDRAFTVCGGVAGQAYVGYTTNAIPDPENPTPEQRAQGDVDRVALGAGGLALEHHYDLHNNNGFNDDGTVKDKRYDETRTILACARINSGPFAGEIYFGSNHGLTRVRGDLFGDHRHPTFDYPSCTTTAGTTYECDAAPEAIGYVWGLNLSNAGNPMLAAEWMFAEVAPSDPTQTYDLVRWTLSSHPWVFSGPPPFPVPGKTAPSWAPPWYERWPLRFAERGKNRAIAQTPDGRYWVASDAHGLVWFTRDGAKLKPFVEVTGEPGTIRALVANPDGTLWVGTDGQGVWKYTPEPPPDALASPPAPEAGSWAKLQGLPAERIFRLYVETRFGKRQLYIGTASGLGVLTE